MNVMANFTNGYLSNIA